MPLSILVWLLYSPAPAPWQDLDKVEFWENKGGGTEILNLIFEN